MSITSANITTEVISDFAAGRLDEVDAQAVQEAIDHDEVIATAVLDARLVALRMNVWLPTRTEFGEGRVERGSNRHMHPFRSAGAVGTARMHGGSSNEGDPSLAR
jgi:hypothetical protein